MEIHYDLFTKVLQPHHIIVLCDWLTFFDPAPSALIVYMPDDLNIREPLERAAERFGIELRPVLSVEGEDLRYRETPILTRLAAQSNTRWLASLNLDTLCYRRGHDGWLADDISFMEKEGLIFLVGALVYAADQPVPGFSHYRLTQRFSNNFAVFRRDAWEEAMKAKPLEMLIGQPEERFHSEWAIEQTMAERNVWGLRRMNTMDWRVINVQRWDQKLLSTRQKFLEGNGIEPFLNLKVEECRYTWERHFDADRPSLLRRWRIKAGRIRREFLGR